jgi:flagellar motor protein MotB
MKKKKKKKQEEKKKKKKQEEKQQENSFILSRNCCYSSAVIASVNLALLARNTDQLIVIGFESNGSFTKASAVCSALRYKVCKLAKEI